MNFFKSLTLNWQQISLFKLSVFSLGIAIGALWPEIFASYALALVAVALVSGAYITYVWWKQ